MGKDPAVLLYTADFLTGVTFMTMAQRGRYITLLCLQHQKGHLSEKEMLKVCGGRDAEIFSKFVRDDEMLYYNERMEQEIERREAHCQKQRANAMKRWHGDGNAMALPLENANEIDKGLKNKGGAGGEAGGKEGSFDPGPYVEVYNLLCTNLPKVVKLTEKRRKAARAFAKEFSVDEFKVICANLNGSGFYTGNNDRGWKADFDYIMRTDKASRFLEGGERNVKRQDKPARFGTERPTGNYDHLAIDPFKDG